MFKIVSLLLIVMPLVTSAATTPPPKLRDWKRLWDRSETIKETTVVGHWVLIGRAGGQDCHRDNRILYAPKDDFDDQGLMNDDGTFPNLDFARYNFKSGERLGIWGNVLEHKEANQGPIVVKDTEPQFEFWAYEKRCKLWPNGRLDCPPATRSGEIKFTNSCRISADEAKQMICMVDPRDRRDRSYCTGGAIYKAEIFSRTN